MKIYSVTTGGDYFYVSAESAKHARKRVYGNDSLTDESCNRIETARSSKKAAWEHSRRNKSYGVHIMF